MDRYEKRKANMLAKIMEDHQVTLDEAIEMYKQKFKEMASKGGKNSTHRPFKDKEKASKAGKKRWQVKP